MGYAPPRPADADGAQLQRATKQFLVEMAELMHLPAKAAASLVDRAPIRGSGGFLCRLEIAAEAPAAIRPEVLLPISVHELERRDVAHLLVLQEALAAELRWRVGLSTDGMLQLVAMDWIEDPQDAAFALDLGQILGRDTMRQLLGSARRAPS